MTTSNSAGFPGQRCHSGLPYRTQDDVIAGVVITATDIGEITKLQQSANSEGTA